MSTIDAWPDDKSGNGVPYSDGEPYPQRTAAEQVEATANLQSGNSTDSHLSPAPAAAIVKADSLDPPMRSAAATSAPTPSFYEQQAQELEAMALTDMSLRAKNAMNAAAHDLRQLGRELYEAQAQIAELKEKLERTPDEWMELCAKQDKELAAIRKTGMVMVPVDKLIQWLRDLDTGTPILMRVLAKELRAMLTAAKEPK